MGLNAKDHSLPRSSSEIFFIQAYHYWGLWKRKLVVGISNEEYHTLPGGDEGGCPEILTQNSKCGKLFLLFLVVITFLFSGCNNLTLS